MKGYSPPHLRFGGMSQAVRSGDLIVVSGQAAFDSSTQITELGAYEQALQCFENVRLALDEAGAALPQVVKLVSYLVDPGDFPAYSKAKREVFPSIDAPASTTVVVSALLDNRMRVEVEAWACVEEETG
ncbi:RidA family protein [Tomitella fengzijianii]|uniref:RidA family protein n=1 Tax=Tomitella fengzijianii TaxID=2597660 RepID=UPI00131D9633|nr:RidA family protein [Tomitella fengzijianii]